MSYRIIERAAIRVAYTTSIGDPSASDAFQRLEQVVPLKGNRFFATFDSLTQEYRACVALKAEQSGAWYGLPEGVLSGGTQATSQNWLGRSPTSWPASRQHLPRCAWNTGATRRACPSNTTSARAKLFFTCRFRPKRRGTTAFERFSFSPWIEITWGGVPRPRACQSIARGTRRPAISPARH